MRIVLPALLLAGSLGASSDDRQAAIDNPPTGEGISLDFLDESLLNEMSARIVAAYRVKGLNPVADAVKRQFSINACARLALPSLATIFLRATTTPYKAREARRKGYTEDKHPYAAITYTVVPRAHRVLFVRLVPALPSPTPLIPNSRRIVEGLMRV